MYVMLSEIRESAWEGITAAENKTNSINEIMYMQRNITSNLRGIISDMKVCQ